MGEALMRRFLKRYRLKPDGSAGSSSLWGVSTRTHGDAPSCDQHFYKRKQNFRGQTEPTTSAKERRPAAESRYCSALIPPKKKKPNSHINKRS